jgi:hypothetical protein
MSKLINYCEGVMEAAWLAAVVALPLFHNVHGENFESEKNHFLRALAAILLTAWFAKGVLQWVAPRSAKNPSRPFDFVKTPLALCILLFSAEMIVSTVFSISPWESFWGVSARRLGTYSYLSCLVFFAAIASTVRSDQQVNRLITAIIMTSVPVSLYGIGQRYSIEPMIRSYGIEVMRVGSTFAQSVYLGAYLIMVFPLTVSRMLAHWQKPAIGEEKRATKLRPQVALYGSVAVLQVICIFLTVSRGPFVGFAFGSAIMCLLVSILWKKKTLVFATVSGGILIVAGLALLAWKYNPIPGSGRRADLQRFAAIFKPKTGSSGRDAIWNVAADAAHFSTRKMNCTRILWQRCAQSSVTARIQSHLSIECTARRNTIRRWTPELLWTGSIMIFGTC